MNNTEIALALSQLQYRCHTIASEKGWHDEPRTFGDVTALIHTEVSEAMEAFRERGSATQTWRREDGKPEGVASEWADTIIRILDEAEELGVPVISELFAKMEFNDSRSYRHGGKHL